MAANRRRIEVIETVEEIVDDLLTSALDEIDRIGTSQDNVVTTGNTQEVHIEEEEERQARGESEVKAREQSMENEVSDAEREADSDTRIQILLKLLDLACSMVCTYILNYADIRTYTVMYMYMYVRMLKPDT